MGGMGGRKEVMVCGDDTICILAGLSWQTDPENDTTAWGQDGGEHGGVEGGV